MAISDAEFTAWLSSNDRQPVVLLEIDGFRYGGTGAPVTGEITDYISDRGYIDPFDSSSPNNYKAQVVSSVTVSDLIGGVLLKPLTIHRPEGYWGPNRTAHQHRECKVYYGDKRWARSDFRAQITAVMKDSIEEKPLTHRLTFINPADELFDQVLDPEYYPFLFGECRNIKPKKESATEYVFYHPSDYDFNGISADVSGLTVGGVTQTEGSDYTLASANENTDVEKTTITFSTAPTLEVALRGERRTLPNVLDEINRFLDRPITYNSATFSHLASSDYVAFALSSSANAKSWINHLFESFGANARYNIDGEIEFFVLDEPATSVLTIRENDIRGRLRHVSNDPVVNYLQLRWWKNWGVQSASDLDAAYDASLDPTEEWRVYSTATPASELKGSTIIDTLLAFQTIAHAEGARRYGLKNTWRNRWKVSTSIRTIELAVGETITIETDDYDFAAGEDFVVIGIDKVLTESRCELRIWK